MELYEQVGQIASRSDLRNFIELLREDLRKNPQRWENDTLDSFLEAMSAWMTDTNDRGNAVPN